MEQNELDKITQLLKTSECSNQILAIQLAVGQGLSIDEIVELCLCLETEVTIPYTEREMILCDYGLVYDNRRTGADAYIQGWSLTLRSSYLFDNEYIYSEDITPIKLKMIKEIIESVI